MMLRRLPSQSSEPPTHTHTHALPLSSSATVSVESFSKRQQTPAFLEKLFDILEDPAYGALIAWEPDGTSFIIKRVNEFSETVLPRFFKHSNIQSYIRQLNMYGFSKTRHDSNHHEFTHKLFQRGRRDLLPLIRRKTQQTTRSNNNNSNNNTSAASACVSDCLLTNNNNNNNNNTQAHAASIHGHESLSSDASSGAHVTRCKRPLLSSAAPLIAFAQGPLSTTTAESISSAYSKRVLKLEDDSEEFSDPSLCVRDERCQNSSGAGASSRYHVNNVNVNALQERVQQLEETMRTLVTQHNALCEAVQFCHRHHVQHSLQCGTNCFAENDKNNNSNNSKDDSHTKCGTPEAHRGPESVGEAPWKRARSVEDSSQRSSWSPAVRTLTRFEALQIEDHFGSIDFAQFQVSATEKKKEEASVRERKSTNAVRATNRTDKGEEEEENNNRTHNSKNNNENSQQHAHSGSLSSSSSLSPFPSLSLSFSSSTLFTKSYTLDSGLEAITAAADFLERQRDRERDRERVSASVSASASTSTSASSSALQAMMHAHSQQGAPLSRSVSHGFC